MYTCTMYYCVYTCIHTSRCTCTVYQEKTSEKLSAMYGFLVQIVCGFEAVWLPNTVCTCTHYVLHSLYGFPQLSTILEYTQYVWRTCIHVHAYNCTYIHTYICCTIYMYMYYRCTRKKQRKKERRHTCTCTQTHGHHNIKAGSQYMQGPALRCVALSPRVTTLE